jgi:hypothetical protein
MITPLPRLTDELEKTIVTYIRVGGYPHVAAEAAGVPRATFEKWMRSGEKKQAPARYRRFAAAVHQANAQARLTAELAALKGRPLEWLRCGPGKDTPTNPGWSATIRPAPHGDRTGSETVMNGLIRALITLLAPYPEARAAVATALLPDEIGPSTSS